MLLFEKSLPWLTKSALRNIPAPISATVEEKTINVLLVEWIVYPYNQGISPGYMELVILHTAAWVVHQSCRIGLCKCAIAGYIE